MKPLCSVCAFRIWKISSCLRMPVAPATLRSFAIWVSCWMLLSFSSVMFRPWPRRPFLTLAAAALPAFRTRASCRWPPSGRGGRFGGALGGVSWRGWPLPDGAAGRHVHPSRDRRARGCRVRGARRVRAGCGAPSSCGAAAGLQSRPPALARPRLPPPKAVSAVRVRLRRRRSADARRRCAWLFCGMRTTGVLIG